KGLTKLTDLGLQGTRVSDTGLKYLAGPGWPRSEPAASARGFALTLADAAGSEGVRCELLGLSLRTAACHNTLFAGGPHHVAASASSASGVFPHLLLLRHLAPRARAGVGRWHPQPVRRPAAAT